VTVPPVATPVVVTPTDARSIEIRLALSEGAARALFEPRVRRLVEIETERFAVLAPHAVGPLGDNVAYVWVDQPTPAKVVVEVRVGDHAVQRREIAVRGLAGDVAARLVAIAVSDVVLAGMAPRPAPQPPPPPPKRTPEEVERARRVEPALVLSPGAEVAVLPAVAGVLGGPSLALAFRRFGASESIFGRWLTGPTQGSNLRWLELGVSAEYRFWLGRSVRLALGGQGAFSSVHLADATGIEGLVGQHDAWSARAGGVVGVDVRLAAPAWLALHVEPGAVLRPVPFATGAPSAATLQGAWIGVGLALHFEPFALRDP
jgi:hypothetical protein